MLKISICDSGCGISEELQAKVFDEGYTSKATGNGLGLFISKEAMKEQYGDLVLVSSQKGETVFEVTVSRI